MSTVRLDGDVWQLRGCLGDSWRWYVGPEKALDAPGWIPGRVPGSVLDDLERAGEAVSPYHERDSLLSEWVPARAWVYRRMFRAPPLGADERAVLEFAGVDHRASVYVDGELAGEHDGGLSPFSCEVTAALAGGGEHLLAVVVHPAPPSEPQVGDTARVRAHKSRMGYGWDFCPRLIHQGIWQEVLLRCGPSAAWVPQPAVDYRHDERRATVRVAGAEQLVLLADGKTVATTAAEELEVAQPRLWWPNGSGEPYCYELVARRGERREHFSVGFRELALEPNPGGPVAARPYTLVVNGRALYLRGWNWVPIDALYGVPRPDKLAHLLGLAASSGANCLRVWGGGIIETPAFYTLCDRLGLLVWQEFSLSSSGGASVPSDDPAYLATMAAEADAVIPRRRHHPSLAFWGGGNELARAVPGRDDQPLDESTPVLGLLAAAVARHDPRRTFLPTSPSGPRFLNRRDVIAEEPDGQHDVHGPWEHQGLGAHQPLYDAGTALWHSEVGVEGMTNRRSLEALIGEPHRWPADRSNPLYEHLGAWWNNAPLVQDSFGGRLGDLAALRHASQLLQHDGLRYAVEANLRRAPRSSGVWPWQLNESYPNAWCTAVLDHRGDPKPAYHAVRRAYRPAHVCAAFATPAWNGATEASARIVAWGGAGSVVARYVDLAGAVLASAHFALPARRAPVMLGELRVPLAAVAGEIFLLDLLLETESGERADNRYLQSAAADFAPLTALGRAEVALERADTDAVTLRHLGGPAALGIVLEDDRPAAAPGWVVFADNLIDLLPGEERRIAFTLEGVERRSLRVRAEGWNTDLLVLGAGAAAAREGA